MKRRNPPMEPDATTPESAAPPLGGGRADPTGVDAASSEKRGYQIEKEESAEEAKDRRETVSRDVERE